MAYFDTLLTVLIVAGAVLYLLLRAFKGRGGCGCGCRKDNSPITEIHDLRDKENG